MRFYRVVQYTTVDSSKGFVWTTTKGGAEKILARFKRNYADDNPENSKIEVVEIKPTRAGILSALHIYASFADNG